jgi:hypothetical protein
MQEEGVRCAEAGRYRLRFEGDDSAGWADELQVPGLSQRPDERERLVFGQ